MEKEDILGIIQNENKVVSTTMTLYLLTDYSNQLQENLCFSQYEKIKVDA